MYYFSTILFAILTVVIVGLNAETTASSKRVRAFSRNCVSDSDCEFSHSGMTPVFLKCNSGKCQCENSSNMVMDVAWYTVRIVENECAVNYNAPCGYSNGLRLVCDTGKRCIQRRCRPGTRVQPLNYSCDEDIDCQSGLTCKQRENSFPASKSCQ
ncbi:hypothetical protein HA402_001602 [Bradysia odoriphaga]|nr:hypothetical protein HA402_001602 [Bradysia odoriphaga]